jgi:hypothetical protein
MKESSYMAYEIIIPDRPSRFATDFIIAEGIAAYHMGKVGDLVLTPFSDLVSKFDEDYPWNAYYSE